MGCQPGSGETLADKLGIKLTSREISTPSQLLISVYFYDDYTAGTICVPVITLKLRHGTDLTSDESPSLILYWCVSIANIQQISKPNIASPLVTSPEGDTRFIDVRSEAVSEVHKGELSAVIMATVVSHYQL